MTSSHNYGVNTLSLQGGNHDATRNYLEVLIYLAVLGMLMSLGGDAEAAGPMAGEAAMSQSA